jgi:RNA polymerase sigma-70 factor, ECF subfamily
LDERNDPVRKPKQTSNLVSGVEDLSQDAHEFQTSPLPGKRFETGPDAVSYSRPVTPSDADLVKQALAGSQAAYHVLVARYATPAVNLAARMVQDRSLAEDLSQEAFARAFERLSSYDSSRRFASWFFQVLHNVVIDHLRKKRLTTVSLEGLQDAGYPGAAGEPGARPDARAEQADLARALDAAMARIRPEYREAIVLRYRQDFSVQEIAETMRLPVGTVKTYLSRARKELASILAAQGWAARTEEPETRRDRIP